MARLNLVVLRCEDVDRAASFYAELGLRFEKHAHGAGPLHYACEELGTVFELYPASEKSPVTRSVRIGFVVDDVDARVQALAEAGGKIVTPPADSPWGRRAVIRDLDGHTVELISNVDPSAGA